MPSTAGLPPSWTCSDKYDHFGKWYFPPYADKSFNHKTFSCEDGKRGATINADKCFPGGYRAREGTCLDKSICAATRPWWT